MSNKRSPIKNTLVPYEAGWAILTPLDENAKPMVDRGVITPTDFLTSSTFTTNTTYTEIATGTGQNNNQPSGRSATLSITLSAFSPIFHALAAGELEYLPDKALTNNRIEHILPDLPAEPMEQEFVTYVFENPKLYPAANNDGYYRFIITDNNGNHLLQRDQAVKGTYKYDPDTHTLSFSKEYAGTRIFIAYDIEDANAVIYRANPILKANKFMLETYGIVQDVFSNNTYKVKRSLTRCQISGDLPTMPSQADPSTSITYTFETIPVPAGEVPWENTWTEYKPEQYVADSGDNIVNGYSDEFDD